MTSQARITDPGWLKHTTTKVGLFWNRCDLEVLVLVSWGHWEADIRTMVLQNITLHILLTEEYWDDFGHKHLNRLLQAKSVTRLWRPPQEVTSQPAGGAEHQRVTGYMWCTSVCKGRGVQDGEGHLKEASWSSQDDSFLSLYPHKRVRISAASDCCHMWDWEVRRCHQTEIPPVVFLSWKNMRQCSLVTCSICGKFIPGPKIVFLWDISFVLFVCASRLVMYRPDTVYAC